MRIDSFFLFIYPLFAILLINRDWHLYQMKHIQYISTDNDEVENEDDEPDIYDDSYSTAISGTRW